MKEAVNIPRSMESLLVYQYNTRRSKDVVMAQFLRDPEVLKADIIAIQEPWENPFKDDTHHPAKQTHELLWPAEAETGGRARVYMFVSRKLAGWSHVAYSKDVQELRLKVSTRSESIEIREVRFVNVYNQKEEGWEGLNLLKCIILSAQDQNRRKMSYLILGDFNLHHPVWGGDKVTVDKEAEDVLELMDMANLDLWLEPGTITWPGERNQAGTTIDLVLASSSLRGRMINCSVDEEVHADSDHLPVRTELDLKTSEVEVIKRRCWKKMDEKKFLEFVSANLLSKRGTWNLDIDTVTPADIDTATEYLVEVVQQGVQESTPWARPSTWAQRGWNEECIEAIKATRRAYRNWRDSKHEDFLWETDKETRMAIQDAYHSEYKTTRNKKGSILGKAIRKGYRSWVKDAVNDGNLWNMSK